MCDPISVALIATSVTAGSAIYSGYQQKEMANYQAAQARADANAEEQAAAIRAEKIREQAKRQASSVRAALAASGVSIDSESANLINKDTIRRGELDAITGVNDATDAAGRLRAQATSLRYAGNSAVVAGYASAAGTALTSYSAYKSGWYGGDRGFNRTSSADTYAGIN